MGLEINLIAFIPLISNKKNILISEAILKYFLIQTLTSANLLFFILIININIFYFNINLQIIYPLLNFALLIKIGAAPFHFWFPSVIEGITWLNCFILSSWQKITPIIVLSYCSCYPILILRIILSAIFGGIGGLNQTSIRKIIAYSSIRHLRWILISTLININLWLTYFFFYSLISGTIIYIYNLIKSFYLTQLFNNKFNSYFFYRFSINLFSLGGLPPFLGFLPKWLVINFIINNNYKIIILIIIIITLINLIYYINISFRAIILNFNQSKWFKLYINKIKISIISLFTTISLIGLIFITLINTFII